jgi:hypothetical protein
MSGTGEATADFAGEARDFRIRLGQIRRIEEKCGGVGIGEVCRRLARASYMLTRATDADGKLDLLAALASGVEIHAEDVRSPIYEGLVGFGMSTAEATKLVRHEIDDRGVRGLLENAAVALVVLLGSQEAPKEDLGEPQAGDHPATPASEPTSDTSTASDKPSA